MKRSIVSKIFAFLLSISCSKDENAKLVPIADDRVRLVKAFPNLNFSISLDFQSPDDITNRVFVAEKGGVLNLFLNTIMMPKTNL